MAAALTPTAPASAVLAGMELFLGLPSPALDEVMACARIRRLAKGETVFTQGEPAKHCHALVEGRIRIAQSDEDGAQVVVRFIGRGETFGTVALFTDRKYPAEAVAVLDSTEVNWTEAALIELIDRYPRIALNIVRLVGARLQEVQKRLHELATQRVERRLAHALIRLATQGGQPAGGATQIGFPLTRKDLAEMCGTTLHTASRILTSWEKTGLVKTSRQRLTVRDPAGLGRIAEDLI